MPINASYEYFNAEKEYLNSKNLSDKIFWLEEMIKRAPKHKGSENLLAELRGRLKKLREKAEKTSSKKSKKKGIRKEGFQFVLIGKTKSGKSLLLSKLTNAKPLVSEFPFTTQEPVIGTFEFGGVKAQVIELPAIDSDFFDIGIANNADLLLIVLEKIEEIEEIEKIIFRLEKRRIYIFNKCEKLSAEELRKLNEKIKSKKINGVLVSALNSTGLDDLKNKMFSEMGIVRIYMKEPGKPKSETPLVLKKGFTIRDVAESIYKGFSERVKETRLTGPSSKFPNQKVGLGHVVEDNDIVEFHTKN